MARMEDILNLPVQDPQGVVEFSADHMEWVKVGGGRLGADHIALIPFARVHDFVRGESSNARCPASFRVESRRKRREGSVSRPRVDGYLEYTLYWCSYGPEDYRESQPDGPNAKPASGKGSRPGRRHMMRGCLCHFTVKRLYTRPHLALVIYNQREHVDKSGAPCHGVLDRDALGTRAMYAPRISEELRLKVMSMLYAGVSLDAVIQHHAEVVRGHGGPHSRDDLLTRNDVRNMERLVRNSSHELDPDDGCSVKMWVQRHLKHVFYYSQGDSGSERFVLGLQTDWQLQQMMRYGHCGSMAFHSMLGSKKLKSPLFTLLVFDLSRNAIPVAWIVSSCFVNQDIQKWIGILVERAQAKDTTWRLNSFLVDDPLLDISAIREAFQCRVLLCTWRVRRSWIRSLSKYCFNVDVQREMFKQLGWVLYCTRSGQHAVDTVEEFMQVFVDQCSFMDYFKRRWLPRLEMWISAVKSLPVSSPEHNAAIESYHLRLKSKLFDERNADSWSRVDWLINTLTSEFHSLFWFDQYSTETGYFDNLMDKTFATNAWYNALHIPDVDIILDERNLQIAKVISQTNKTLAYTILNPGSEFSLCDCPWSTMGNLCKHVVKVALFCKSRHIARPLQSAQVYRQTLLSLLHNTPDDPLVLDHAILHATRLQQDIKGLEELSNNGLLQPLPPDIDSHVAENVFSPRIYQLNQ